MKKLYIVSLLLILFTASSGMAGDSEDYFKVLQPGDKGLYSGSLNTVVVKTDPDKVDKFIINLDNTHNYTIETEKGRDTYCRTVELSPSKNKITINAYKKGKKLQKKSLSVYFLQELFEGENDDSDGYLKLFFHTQEQEDECVACHDMTSNVPENGDDAFDDVSKTTCYNCHQDMLDKKNTHAPAANWLCTKCHDGEVGDYNQEDEGASKYLVRSPVKYVCGECHDSVQEWDFNPYVHGPVNDGKCVRCHNPHGSNHEFFLRKRIWYLCTTCHTEKAIPGNHIVAGFVFGRNKGAHPTKDRRDPVRKDREFTCTSCHNPHGSSGIYLLRMKGSQPFNVCRRCHKK